MLLGNTNLCVLNSTIQCYLESMCCGTSKILVLTKSDAKVVCPKCHRIFHHETVCSSIQLPTIDFNNIFSLLSVEGLKDLKSLCAKFEKDFL